MSQKLTDKTAKENPDAKIAAETVLIDNATTRISEIVFQSDEQTGWHLHDWGLCDRATIGRLPRNRRRRWHRAHDGLQTGRDQL